MKNPRKGNLRNDFFERQRQDGPKRRGTFDGKSRQSTNGELPHFGACMDNDSALKRTKHACVMPRACLRLARVSLAVAFHRVLHQHPRLTVPGFFNYRRRCSDRRSSRLSAIRYIPRTYLHPGIAREKRNFWDEIFDIEIK